MAIHLTLQSMLYESLPEMLSVANYSIEYRKSDGGCYGFPASLLLLSIADSIGSYVKKGNVENHFKILNDANYYGLNLKNNEIEIIYKHFRSLLSHNTLISPKVGLKIGEVSDPILQNQSGKYWLNLIPFYAVSEKAVTFLLNNPEILKNNETILNINKK